MGPFWGFQEAWLSLVASIFDMAIYPTLFVLYLGRLWPAATAGHRGVAIAAAMIAVCLVWNLLGAKAVGSGSVLLGALMLTPFAVITGYAFFRHITFGPAPPAQGSLLTGMLVAMWNYMGWDNASTIAAEVERPQRTYPRAMLLAVLIVAVSYIVPVAAMWMTGLAPSAWDTGFWADIAGLMGGPWLRVALALGGMISGFGMFNALVMSYSRLPLAMAQDGMLPKVFGKLAPKTRAPWVAILVLAVLWAPCLLLGFERLVTIDILLYGVALSLEFMALIVLRIREPELPRPFKVPGGLLGAIAIGIPPMLLLGFSIVRSEHESVLGMSSFAFGMILILAGVVAYFVNHAVKPEGWIPAEEKPQPAA
jgi:amino acid transporter